MDTSITIEITGLAHGGEGVGRIDGQVCFVEQAIPGDRVQVTVTRRTPRALWAEIEFVETPSPDRLSPGCPVFGQCGGCSWLHMRPETQNTWKAQIVKDCLRRIGGLEADVACEEDPALRLQYRTRARVHVAQGRTGFLARASHDLVGIETCPLCHPALNAAIEKLQGANITGEVEITVNPDTAQTLIWTDWRSRPLSALFQDYNGPWDASSRAQFTFDGVPILNGCFAQSSLLLNRLLTRQVQAFAGQPGTVLDLYCGNGNLSLGLARAGAQVTGIDHDHAVVSAANALGLGQYQAGNETAFAHAITQQPWDVILLDPPRTGAKAITAALAKAQAHTLIYVSCDPATLARDLRVLTTSGWRLDQAAALDLFPNTPHVETVCRLIRD